MRLRRSGRPDQSTGQAHAALHIFARLRCGAVTVPDFDFDGIEMERNDWAAWPAGVFGEDDSPGAHARVDRSLCMGQRIQHLMLAVPPRENHTRRRRRLFDILQAIYKHRHTTITSRSRSSIVDDLIALCCKLIGWQRRLGRQSSAA